MGSRRSGASTRTPTTSRGNGPRSSVATLTCVDLVSTVRAHRVVTLTGVGGVGKTRLAVHAAAELVGEFSNVWFVPLADVADSSDVESAVAVAIGTTGTSEPLSAMRMLLAAQRTLLVIDNCEHVVEGAARVVDALTGSCPELHVLATGREALAIDGEHVVPVRPARRVHQCRRPLPGAGGRRGGRPPRGASGRPSSTSAPVSTGLPLAIELAAARTPSLGVDGVLTRSTRASRSGARSVGASTSGTAPFRPRSSGRTGCSRTDEQRLFDWLATFVNGFELDAADHMAAAMGVARERPSRPSKRSCSGAWS